MSITKLRSHQQMIELDTMIVRACDIKTIDASDLESLEQVYVTIDGVEEPYTSSGFNALMLIYAFAPTWLEGKPYVKWKKNAWVVHNLFGHPIMQLLAFCGRYRLAMKVHDSTVPRPTGFKK